MSDASRVVVRAVKETTAGTTPASALQTLRTTGFSLKRATQWVMSQEIRSDRQITDNVRVGANVEGEIPFELVYGNLDTTAADLLSGTLGGAWQVDTGLSGAAVGTDLLENGTTATPFTIEAEYADITQFHVFKGCFVNTLSLSITPGQIITGNLGFLGMSDAVAGSSAGTGAATAAVAGSAMNAVSNVSAVTEGGSAIELLQLDLSINNGRRVQPVIGSLTPDGIGSGRFNVSGSIRLYFADAALITKYNAATESSLAFTTTDADGNAYAFSIDALKYTDFPKPNDGPEGDIIATVPFQGYMDATTEKTLSMTRTDAV